MSEPRIIRVGEPPTEDSFTLPTVDEQLRTASLIVHLQLRNISERSRKGLTITAEELKLFKELSALLIDLKKLQPTLTAEALPQLSLDELTGLYREIGRLMREKATP